MYTGYVQPSLSPCWVEWCRNRRCGCHLGGHDSKPRRLVKLQDFKGTGIMPARRHVGPFGHTQDNHQTFTGWLDIQGARLTSTVCSLWLPPCSTALAKWEAPSSPTSKSTEKQLILRKSRQRKNRQKPLMKGFGYHQIPFKKCLS